MSARVGGGELRNDVWQQRVVAARDQVARASRRRSWLRQVVAAAWNDVAYPAAWVWNVAGIARDDVNVQMEDRLACGLADVDADVEAVRAVALEDGGPRGVYRVRERVTFVRCRVEPPRDVATRYEQRVAGGDRETRPTSHEPGRIRGTGGLRKGRRMGNRQTAARSSGSRPPFDSKRPLQADRSAFRTAPTRHATLGASGEVARRADVTKLERRSPSASPLTTCHQCRTWLKPGGHDQRTPLLAVRTACLSVAPPHDGMRSFVTNNLFLNCCRSGRQLQDSVRSAPDDPT